MSTQPRYGHIFIAYTPDPVFHTAVISEQGLRFGERPRRNATGLDPCTASRLHSYDKFETPRSNATVEASPFTSKDFRASEPCSLHRRDRLCQGRWSKDLWAVVKPACDQQNGHLRFSSKVLGRRASAMRKMARILSSTELRGFDRGPVCWHEEVLILVIGLAVPSPYSAVYAGPGSGCVLCR